MTFKHKLAHRLALLRGPWMAAPVAVREPHRAVTQLVVSPQSVTLQDNQRTRLTVKLRRAVS